MSYCMMKCGCGYNGDMFDFTRTAIFGDLPRGEFQCPKCNSDMNLILGGLQAVSAESI